MILYLDSSILELRQRGASVEIVTARLVKNERIMGEEENSAEYKENLQ